VYFLFSNLYILNAVRCPYVCSSVTLGVASSVANDVIIRTGAASAEREWRHNENDVIMIIAGLWRYGDWRHVATGCKALVTCSKSFSYLTYHYHGTTIVSVLTAVFQVSLVVVFCQFSSSDCLEREPVRISETGFFQRPIALSVSDSSSGYSSSARPPGCWFRKKERLNIFYSCYSSMVIKATPY